MPRLLVELGASLRRHRHRQGLSAAVVARRARVGLRTLEGLERGERAADLSTLLRVLHVLDLQLWAIERDRVRGVVRVRRTPTAGAPRPNLPRPRR